MKSDDLTQAIVRMLFHWKSGEANHKKKRIRPTYTNTSTHKQAVAFVLQFNHCALINNFRLHFLGADYSKYTYNMSNV
jgi:hypothetical protein